MDCEYDELYCDELCCDEPTMEEEEQGRIIQESYTPTGFTFLTNITVDSNEMRIIEYSLEGKYLGEPLSEYLMMLRENNGDVALGDAFDCLGRHIGGVSPFLPYERDLWFAVYIPERKYEGC